MQNRVLPCLSQLGILRPGVPGGLKFRERKQVTGIALAIDCFLQTTGQPGRKLSDCCKVTWLPKGVSRATCGKNRAFCFSFELILLCLAVYLQCFPLFFNTAVAIHEIKIAFSGRRGRTFKSCRPDFCVSYCYKRIYGNNFHGL